MTEVTTTTATPFVSDVLRDNFVTEVSGAFGKVEKATRGLVGTLLTSARSLERVVTDEDFAEHLAAILRKGLKAKVGAASVKVYLAHAKVATIAATGRPPVSEALPLGKHWADQLTTKRKLEGVNAYYKRVNALLKLATRNEAGHLILPEGYSLLGEKTASLETETPATDAPATDAPGSAGQSQDDEGGLNVDPTEAKATTRENAATVLMGNAKAAAALLALLDDKAGKAKLSALLAEHDKAAKAAKAKAEADAKLGEAAAAFAAGLANAA